MHTLKKDKSINSSSHFLQHLLKLNFLLVLLAIKEVNRVQTLATQ